MSDKYKEVKEVATNGIVFGPALQHFHSGEILQLLADLEKANETIAALRKALGEKNEVTMSEKENEG
jgi:TusA-related sulfurtransferase